MATRAWLGGGVLVGLVLPALASCGSAPPGPLDGDCSARILFQGKIFRPYNNAVQSAATEPDRLGTADVVDCDRRPVDHVAIRRIRGVDPNIAIAVVDADARGVYLREGTTSTDWPPQLRQRANR